MPIPDAINYLVITIWLLIPLRQIKTNYYFFFLINAIASLYLLINLILLVHPAYFFLGAGFFLIISLFDFKKTPHYILFLSGVLMISIILPFFLSIGTITIILIIQHIIIFTIILKRIVVYSSEYKKLNIFHFVLLFYEMTMITRFIVVMGNIRTGITFFYITAAFGILIGIFFLFYNEKNSPAIYLEEKSIQP